MWYSKYILNKRIINGILIVRNPSNLLLIEIDNINIYVKISSIYELPIVQIKYIFLCFDRAEWKG